ncbi:MAG: UDP-N-acetylmuramoyl-tripeptide--D-alanyl-D-alanine ligase, partial [Deltaproteobacteria bacterium]|nr:UDP-N-acetylmuramoyl-tripeptide--D-alanyl-D-alanine ligase [Deltaproteobacteria bacterium]
MNANACLYPDNDEPTAQVNRNNLEIYIKARHGSSQIPQFSADLPVIIFQTDGVFLDAQTGQMHALCTDSRQQGHRKMPELSIDSLQEILDLGSQYLASQIQENGQYRYGYFPCFGREIPTYNTLRHASSTYALLESYEACRTSFKTGKTPNSSTTPVISNQRVTLNTLTDIQQRIGKALHYLITHWIRHYKDELSYLTDVEDDIKLGGNAVTILALVKYISVFPDDGNNAAYMNLANWLANGIIAMQQHNGSFVHVLNANDLSVKKRHRIIYYDGEATFSLMRLYGITHEQKLLDCVVHAFEYFIANHHERAHDHWLAYCSNELVKYLPEKKYFDFAVRNVRGHVTFIRERITTFPTL